jgi:hypothetical protein
MNGLVGIAPGLSTSLGVSSSSLHTLDHFAEQEGDEGIQKKKKKKPVPNL